MRSVGIRLLSIERRGLLVDLFLLEPLVPSTAQPLELTIMLQDLFVVLTL